MIVPIPFALLLGASVTFLLLLAAHLICWRWRDQMHRTVAYCVGVSCIGAGMLTVSALLQDWLIVVAFVTVALPGGLLILAAWWLRGALAPQNPLDRIRSEAARAVPGAPDPRRN